MLPLSHRCSQSAGVSEMAISGTGDVSTGPLRDLMLRAARRWASNASISLERLTVDLFSSQDAVDCRHRMRGAPDGWDSSAVSNEPPRNNDNKHSTITTLS